MEINWEIIIINAIAATPPTILAWAALKKSKENNAEIKEVKQQTDGILEKVGAAKKAEGEATGELKGVQKERQESRDRVGQVKSNDRRGSPIKSDPVLEKIEQNTGKTAEATADVAAAIKDKK